MFAKTWKKIGLIILAIACIFNIMFKFVGRVPFWQQVKNAVIYLQSTIND